MPTLTDVKHAIENMIREFGADAPVAVFDPTGKGESFTGDFELITGEKPDGEIVALIIPRPGNVVVTLPDGSTAPLSQWKKFPLQ